MSALLSSSRHAIRSLGVIRQLQAEVAAMHPEDEAGQHIHGFMSSAEALMRLPADELRPVLDDLKLTVARLHTTVYRIEDAS